MGWIALLGMGCVVYCVAELAFAAGRSRNPARFGAVDLSTGKPIDVVFDRRRETRPPQNYRPLRCTA